MWNTNGVKMMLLVSLLGLGLAACTPKHHRLKIILKEAMRDDLRVMVSTIINLRTTKFHRTIFGHIDYNISSVMEGNYFYIIALLELLQAK